MPVPLLAAAMAPEAIKAATALGAQKDVCVFSGRYQPMIWLKGAARKKAQAAGTPCQIPDPHWPDGWQLNVPAWMFVIAGVGGVSLGALIILEAQGKLGPLKEALGLKKKPGVLGMGFLGL